MAITTVAAALAGLQSPEELIKSIPTSVSARWFSTFYWSGVPAAPSIPAVGVNGAPLTSAAGQIPWRNPASGNSHLGRLTIMSHDDGTFMLCDRLWHNNGLSATLTSSQPIASGAFPARDADGSTNGRDVFVGMEVTTALGTGVPTLTLGYTNSAGTAGRTVTTAAITASMIAGSFIPLGVQVGDEGVRTIQSFQLSASMAAGAYSLVAYRILARTSGIAISRESSIDALSGGFCRLYDNTVPWALWIPTTTSAGALIAQMTVTQG